MSVSQTDKRTDYEGRGKAAKVEKMFKEEIKVVAGNEWLAGNLCYHLKSRPKCIITLQRKRY